MNRNSVDRGFPVKSHVSPPVCDKEDGGDAGQYGVRCGERATVHCRKKTKDEGEEKRARGKGGQAGAAEDMCVCVCGGRCVDMQVVVLGRAARTLPPWWREAIAGELQIADWF